MTIELSSVAPTIATNGRISKYMSLITSCKFAANASSFSDAVLAWAKTSLTNQASPKIFPMTTSQSIINHQTIRLEENFFIIGMVNISKIISSIIIDVLAFQAKKMPTQWARNLQYKKNIFRMLQSTIFHVLEDLHGFQLLKITLRIILVFLMEIAL